MIEVVLDRMGRALLASASAREHQRHHARTTTPAETQHPETMAAPAVPAPPLSEGERRWLLVTEVPVLACALAALAWVPAQRPLNALVCVVLVAAYAGACNVRIPLSNGWAPSSQLVFVPMLFVAPLNLVPLMVLASGVAECVARYHGRRRGLARSVICLGDSWYALGPVLVLAAAGHDTFAWAHWPVYATALAAQLAVNALCGCVRARLHAGDRTPLRDVVAVTSAIDIILAMPALSVAAVALQAPVAAALTCAAMLVISGGFTSQRSGRLMQRDHATHDALTGLPNRVLFGELAATASQRARRDTEACAVMLIDLNAFKAINDELGHQAGDRILMQAAGRLRDGVRAADTVARLGGDEFAVLLSGHQTLETAGRQS
ncbi:MAG: hypothetical protein QOD83_2805 [Solirubrobacteraceae bacterium]|jgi:GGDEF domain-containing protein|nr:hypothetical protein [Solirubrobacteraceae bacterium]